MTLERDLFAAAMALVDEVLDRPPTEREALLGREDLDPRVLAEARRLLLADARDGGALSGTAATQAISALEAIDAIAPAREAPGTIFGPFRTLSLLGRGGMAEVWVAERIGADFEQRVALKILPARDDEAAASRFRRERQILARLSHPRIARLVDGGMTGDGRPWLAMELIEGLHLTEHATRHDLDVESRLRLFVQTCAGVQFAHGHLVVHRDLKPSNILVTSDGEPEIVDFGIAKLLEEDDAGLTRTNERPMTLDYAAPEQIEGSAITTATDVWALGVILHELLTGSRPHRTTGKSPLELQRAILSGLPSRPSSSLSASVADGRPSGSPGALRRALRGDLDAIVLKALQRDPQDRYPSAGALGADVQRYLERAPVLARGDATRYLLRSLVRRHRVAVGVAAAAIVSLVVGLVGTVWQARRAREEARSARVAQDYLVSMLEAFDPDLGPGRALTQRDILERGEARVAELDDQPEVQARLLQTFAETWYDLDDNVRARASAEHALALERRVSGPRSAPVANTMDLLGSIAFEDQEFAQAAALFEDALPIALENEGPDGVLVAKILHHLGGARRRLDDYPEAERLHRRALAIYTKRLGEQDPASVSVMCDFAVVLADEGRFAEGAQLQQRACELLAAAKGKDHTDTLRCETNLSRDLIELGRAAEAEALLTDIEARQIRVFGEEWADIESTLQWRAYALDHLGRYEEALRFFDASLARYAKDPSPQNAGVARLLARRATTLRHLARLAEAEETARRSLDLCLAHLGKSHAYTARARLALGAILLDEDRRGEAEGELREAQAIFEKTFGADSWEAAATRREIARVDPKR